MTMPPVPVVFVPLYKSKPWGGRQLDKLFNKALPGDEPIGESWELVSLPGNESRVRGGALAGRTISDLMELWGDDLLGHVPPVDGRFPLLIKFLDAQDNLSVQVHPKPAADDPQGTRPGIKHEAWYILHAEPDAQLYIGLNEDVGPDDLRQAANTPAMVNLLRTWDGVPGRCFYLPSGTLHALGAGLVVAEVQTPSDITYRAYDWNRTGLDGKPRELHIEESLANTRYDVAPDMIDQPNTPIAGPFTAAGEEVSSEALRVAACDRFVMDLVHISTKTCAMPSGEMRIWMMLEGNGRLTHNGYECRFAKGDTVLIPAGLPDTRLDLATDSCRFIDVTVPR